jgi:hypothetical protein
MNIETRKFKTITKLEMYRSKDSAFHMTTGYEANDKELKRYAIDFMKWVEELKDNDIFKFDYLKYKSHNQVCLSLFKIICNKELKLFEAIDGTEYKWIESCKNSALYYCKKGTYNNCHGYDFKSQYPSILAYKGMSFPCKSGKEKKISNINEIPKLFGFFKVKITSYDERFQKVFLFNKNHVYTHVSVFFAMQCKEKENFDISIELDVESNVNCYVYDKKDLIRVTIFKKWYKYLFTLKEKFPENHLCKVITSSLWGRICQHNITYKTEDEL